MLSISDTTKYIQNILNGKESDCNAKKIDKICSIKTEWARNWQPRQRSEADKKIC